MNNGLKLTVSLLVLFISAGYLWSAFSQTQKGLQDQVPPEQQRPERQERRAEGQRGANRGNPEEFRQRMIDELDLSKDQVKQMDEIRNKYMPEGAPPQDGRGNWREMMDEMNKVLTPEQQAKAQEARGRGAARMQERMAQRENEAREALSPADFEDWQRKNEEMRERFMQRMQERRAERRDGEGGGQGNRAGGQRGS